MGMVSILAVISISIVIVDIVIAVRSLISIVTVTIIIIIIMYIIINNNDNRSDRCPAGSSRVGHSSVPASVLQLANTENELDPSHDNGDGGKSCVRTPPPAAAFQRTISVRFSFRIASAVSCEPFRFPLLDVQFRSEMLKRDFTGTPCPRRRSPKTDLYTVLT